MGDDSSTSKQAKREAETSARKRERSHVWRWQSDPPSEVGSPVCTLRCASRSTLVCREGVHIHLPSAIARRWARHLPSHALRAGASSLPSSKVGNISVEFRRLRPLNCIGYAIATPFGAPYALRGSVSSMMDLSGRWSYQALPWVRLPRRCAGADTVCSAGVGTCARSIVASARQGDGVAMLPCFLGDEVPGLERVGPLVRATLPLWCVTSPADWRVAAVRRLMHHITAIAADDRSWFEGR